MEMVILLIYTYDLLFIWPIWDFGRIPNNSPFKYIVIHMYLLSSTSLLTKQISFLGVQFQSHQAQLQISNNYITEADNFFVRQPEDFTGTSKIMNMALTPLAKGIKLSTYLQNDVILSTLDINPHDFAFGFT